MGGKGETHSSERFGDRNHRGGIFPAPALGSLTPWESPGCFWVPEVLPLPSHVPFAPRLLKHSAGEVGLRGVIWGSPKIGVRVCVGVHGCAVGSGAPHGHILPLCPLPGAVRGQLQRRVLAGGALILAPSPPPPPPRSLTLFSLSIYIFFLAQARLSLPN